MLPHDTGNALLTDGYADPFEIPVDLAGTVSTATLLPEPADLRQQFLGLNGSI